MKLYVEGGGESAALHGVCREGFRKFLLSAGLAGRMPRIVACGSRDAAYQDFRTAMKDRPPDELPLLVVDSESAVARGVSPWQHLRQRDSWRRPPGSHDNQAFLMVQRMESWFLADREALAQFFGAGFKQAVIPAWPDLEAVERQRVYEVLAKATADCRRRYAKGKVSFELLAVVRAGRVEAASPHAARLIARLRGL